MSYKTPENALKSKQIYSVGAFSVITNLQMDVFEALESRFWCRSVGNILNQTESCPASLSPRNVSRYSA